MTHGVLTQGFSDAAEYIDRESVEGRRRLLESSIFEIGSSLRENLATVWEECQEPNWDGYNALPVTQDTLRTTYTLLESLPLGFPAPSVGAEPDGHLTLEWYRSARRTLSVSVSADCNLHYAALFGPNRKYGTEAFFGDVPQTILELIRQVYAA